MKELKKMKLKKVINEYVNTIFRHKLQENYKEEIFEAEAELRDISNLNPEYYDKEIKRYTKMRDQVIKVALGYDLKDEDNETLEDAEDLFDEEMEVVETEDGKKQAKKGNEILKIALAAAGVAVVAYGLTRIPGCVNNNVAIVAENEDANEEEQEVVTINNDDTTVVIPVTDNEPVVEVEEEDINELIVKALEDFDAGELNITKEEYKFILNYFNNNLNEEVSVDDVVNSAINPVINADVNKNMKIINTMLGVDDAGVNAGNYKASNILLRDTETKKKIEELEILEEAMHSEDPQVQKDAAAMLYRIEWEINYQVTSSHDDLYINGEAFNGYENIDKVFTKDYSSEFYQSDSAASNVLYLTKILALNPFAHAILGDDFKISEKVVIPDENGAQVIEHSKTIEEIEYDLNVRNCENDDLTLLAKYVDMSVKESNQTLDYEGIYILSK